jgi:hypothetical protein
MLDLEHSKRSRPGRAASLRSKPKASGDLAVLDPKQQLLLEAQALPEPQAPRIWTARKQRKRSVTAVPAQAVPSLGAAALAVRELEARP